MLQLAGSEKKRCCLGFAALRIGATEKQITNIPTPAMLQATAYVVMPGLLKDDVRYNNSTYVRYNNSTCSSLIDTNDSGDLDPAVREATLKRLAKEAGYRFIFTDSNLLYRLINKVDPYLHRIANWVGCQTYGCARI